MSSVLDGIVHLPPPLVLALVFLLPAVEASIFVGVVVPGEIGVVLGGVLANQHRLPLWAVLVAAIAGAVIGDSVGYLVGARYGERLLARIPRALLKPEHVQRTEQALRRQGGKAVFVGRFTAALRALVPGFAGMSGLPYRNFLAWNLAGGGLWATMFVLIGYLAGSQYQRIDRYANYLGIGLLVLIGLVAFVKHRRSRGSDPAQGEAESTPLPASMPLTTGAGARAQQTGPGTDDSVSGPPAA